MHYVEFVKTKHLELETVPSLIRRHLKMAVYVVSL